MSKITHIVIHYTATYADQNLTAADIDKMHRARGWQMIGYHWIIRRDGTVEKGRPESMVGAHVGGQNTGKIGISWIGGLDRATGPNKGVDNRTAAQTESLITLIRECLQRYPGAKVVGHRDLAATQCPGFDVQTWWAGVQNKTTVEPAPLPPGIPAITPGVGENTAHTVEPGDTLWSIARQHGRTVEHLRAFNPDLDETSLAIGETVSLVPSGAADIRAIASDLRALVARLEAAF